MHFVRVVRNFKGNLLYFFIVAAFREAAWADAIKSKTAVIAIIVFAVSKDGFYFFVLHNLRC